MSWFLESQFALLVYLEAAALRIAAGWVKDVLHGKQKESTRVSDFDAAVSQLKVKFGIF